MGAGTSLEATMRLQIAEYQQSLATAKAEAQKFRQDLITKGADLDKKLFEQVEKHKLDLSKARQEVDDIRAAFKVKGIQLEKDLFDKLEKHKLDLSNVKKQLSDLRSGGGGGGVSTSQIFGGTFAANMAYDAVRRASDEMKSFVQRGVEFNYVVNNSEVGIANVLKKFDGLNAVAAKDEAAKALRRLIELEPETAGTLQDLTLGFMKTLAAAKGVGLTTSQNVELTAKFANAVANAGLSLTQITQEYRSILTETITKDSQLAKILGITNEDVAGIRQRGGDLYAFLTEKLGDMASAGDSAQVTWSSFQSSLDKAAGAFAQGLFEDGLQHAKDLSVWLQDNRQSFVDLGADAQKAMQLAVTGMKMLRDETSGLRQNLGSARQWFGDSLGDFIFGEVEYRQMKAMNQLVEEHEQATRKQIQAESELRTIERGRAEEAFANEVRMSKKAHDDAFVGPLQVEEPEMSDARKRAIKQAEASTKAAAKDAAKVTADALSAWHAAETKGINDVQKLREKIAEEQIRTSYDQLSLDEKILNLKEKIAKEAGNAQFAQEIGLESTQLQALIRQEQAQQELTKLIREKTAEEKRATEELHKQADAASKLRNSQMLSRQELAAEARVDALRAAGRDGEADAQARKIRMVKEAMDIQAKTGLDEKESMRIARQRMEDQETAERRALRAAGLASGERPRRKITRKDREDLDPDNRLGLSGRSGPLSRDSGPLSKAGPLTRHGGIAGWEALQRGEIGTLPGRSLENLLYNTPVGGAPLAPPMDARHAQNAAVQSAPVDDKAGMHRTRVEQLLRELNENIKALSE